MSTTIFVTADELFALPMGMGKRYELVAGELRVMSPAGWEHGGIVANIAALLGSYIRTQKIGRAFGAETGFLLSRDPDTVRAPDFAFVANEHLPKTKPTEAFWPGAPDLAAEVLSPGDTSSEVDEKIEAWLKAGCAAVWIVNPKLQSVVIYHSVRNGQLVSAGNILVGDPVLPGFSCNVDEIFE